jgi:hypothetical protein
MSFGLRRNTRIREETLHNATEGGRFKAKQLQLERKMKDYEETIEKLEKKILTLKTEKRIQHDQLQVQEKRHEEALYQNAVTNRENHVQFEKFQKLASEKQKVEEKSQNLNADVTSLQESSNILRAAHERLFTDYQLVGEKCKQLQEENLKLKDENEDLNRSVVNLKVYKEKFVATNKEIVKIYRDKQNVINEKFQLKNVSEKMEKGYLMAVDELNERLKHCLDTIRVLKRKYDNTYSEYQLQKDLVEKQKQGISDLKVQNNQLEIHSNLQKIKNEENIKKIENMSTSLTMYADEVAKTISTKEKKYKEAIEEMKNIYKNKIKKLSSGCKLQKQILEERARDDVIKVVEQQKVVSSQLMQQIKHLVEQIDHLKNRNKLLLDENRAIHLKFQRKMGFKNTTTSPTFSHQALSSSILSNNHIVQNNYKSNDNPGMMIFSSPTKIFNKNSIQGTAISPSTLISHTSDLRINNSHRAYITNDRNSSSHKTGTVRKLVSSSLILRAC